MVTDSQLNLLRAIQGRMDIGHYTLRDIQALLSVGYIQLQFGRPDAYRPFFLSVDITPSGAWYLDHDHRS